MKTRILLLFSFAFASCFWSCQKIWNLERMDPNCPEALRLQPEAAPFDAIDTIIGKNFLTGHPELHWLKINNIPVSGSNIIQVPNDTMLLFIVPKSIGSGPVEVGFTDEIQCNLPKGPGPKFIYKYTAKSAVLYAGTPDDSSCSSCFDTPKGMDVDQNTGDLYVADYNRHVIKKIIPGSLPNTSPDIIAGILDKAGWDDRPQGALSKFNSPADLVLDAVGNIYVADQLNNRIRKIENSQLHAVTTFSGSLSGYIDDTILKDARYRSPVSIATNGTDQFFVTELEGAHRLRKLDLTNDKVSTLFGIGMPGSGANGLNYPTGVEYSTIRNPDYPYLVADMENRKVRAIAGPGMYVPVPDKSVNPFTKPYSLCADGEGNVFVVDQAQAKVYVVYTNDGHEVLAGVGLLYTFNTPSGIAFDRKNKVLYVSDEAAHTIIRIELE